MNVAGYRSKIVAIITGSTLVAAIFLLGNTSTEGAVPGVDKEPHYNITAVGRLCNALPGHAMAALIGNPLCVESLALGGPRTETTTFTIPEGQMNFSSFNTYVPTTVKFTPGCNQTGPNRRTYSAADGRLPTNADGLDNDSDGAIDEADGECLAPGDLVGGMRSETDLALFNSTCTSDIGVDFAFYNIALPNNADDPRASTNIATPNTEGQADRILPLYTDGNGDGMADANSAGVLGYPDWFLDLFDPDWRPLFVSEGGPQEGPGADPTAPHNGPLKPVIPIAMYGAITSVAGTKTPLYFAQFGDGILGAAFTDSNHYFNVAQAGMGQLNMSVLTDTTTAVGSSSTISDFCSELIARTMFFGTTLGRDGAAGGGDDMIRAINPSAAGTAITKYWTTSQRDTDNDSYENQIDTCATIANMDDIRILAPVGDPDGDRIDSACDPTPGNSGINWDGDVDASGFGFQNAQDNCPLIANPSQEENENLTTTSALDGGPKLDGIGNECDSEAGILNVVQNGYAAGVNITMSDTVSNGHYHLETVVEPRCYGGVDGDTDGYCAGDLDVGQDGNATRHNSWSGSLTDTVAADRDGDGYSDYLEGYLGTDPVKACSYSATNVNENSSQKLGLGNLVPLAVDTWPTDFSDDGRSAMADVIFAFVTSLAPGGLNQNAVPPKNRMDFNSDGFVNMTDVILGYVTNLAPTGLNKLCTLETQQ